ncbi:uncharacterized protein LOC109845531 isoform X2 [Asparagus officinalis]|uniref:uncharacterized protein LOC109845531 isoform X2 n=1 Tax=Asparagus officinalis TaxID=4686 RepID=UPI00098E521B|nr:uncharacterized protein LOC109845531 isoform X2 [Asparagus officinalis]
MASSSAITGWYGPLIDLCNASAHVDDFVQLLVFVRSSQPQPRPLKRDDASNNGGTLLKTNIQVGDDTMSYFSVSVWQKYMGSMVVAGDIILLQNVKIVEFRNLLEAATVHISSLLVLVHSCELHACKAIDELVTHGQLGERARAKLERVVNWVQHTESALQHVQKEDLCQKEKAIKNWKACEGMKSMDCLSISEALQIAITCNTKFHAYIAEMFTPFISKSNEYKDEQLFVSKRLSAMVKTNIVEDLISKGCRLCGSPIDSRSVPEQVKLPLYCKKGSNYHHDISMIYRPFMLYVWDQSAQIPLLVKNKAAEILFGKITAENVYKCYQEGKDHKQQHHSNPSSSQHRIKPDFYRIWLILVKTLLIHDQNSPFRFEIAVDREKDVENGRFELVSFTMPCYGS